MDVWIEKRHCVCCDHMQNVFGVEHSHTVCFKCEICGTLTFLQDVIDIVFTPELNIDTT